MKISIILPTYKRAGLYLSRAIESVIAQTYKDWELIIIDNNSKDGTEALVNSYESKNIHFYTINNDGNIAKSRNLGISKSSGEYIAFLDSDDYWYKDKLKACMDALSQKKDYQCICHSEIWEYPENHSLTRHYGPENNFSFEKLLTCGNCLSLSATMVKKSILIKTGSFSEDKDMITAEDYDLWIKISKENKFLFIKDILGVFCLHDDSESANIIKNSKAIVNVIHSHLASTSLLQIALSNAHRNEGKRFYVNGKHMDALRAYLSSINNLSSFTRTIAFIIVLIIPYKYISKIR